MSRARQVMEVARLFDAGAGGKIGAARLNRDLKAIAPEGTTQGSLFVAPNYLELPVLQ